MFVQKERKKNSGTGKWLTSVRRCTGAVHEHHFCNANNIPNNVNRLSMFVLQFIYEKRQKKLVFTFENTRSHGVCARCVRSFNFSFPFRLFAFNVEFVFYVSVSLTDDAAAVLREQEMHRLTNENLILFQGECCNANNVFFSFLLLLLQTGFLFYAQLHRR